MTAIARPATTILLLRDADTPSGMEVFMLRRHRRSGFLPNAWVFPGGRVDPADSIAGHANIHGGEAAITALQQPVDVARATLLAGLRETFEEAGIWLGEHPPPASTRDPLNRGELTLTEVFDTYGSTLDLDRVVPWAWWITPRAEPRRYDTRFLIARTDEEGVHDNHETTDSRWICPSEAVALGQDGFVTAPPTWWSLLELTLFSSVDALFDAAATRAVLPIEPLMVFDDTGMELILPGHPKHEAGEHPHLPHAIRAVDRRWQGFRNDAPYTPSA